MTTHRRSRSLIPLTRFWVYCTTSEKRNANAEAETSVVRVLLRFLSKILGRAPVGFVLPSVVLIDGAEGRENRELAAGDRCSADDEDDAERTEKRG